MGPPHVGFALGGCTVPSRTCFGRLNRFETLNVVQAVFSPCEHRVNFQTSTLDAAGCENCALPCQGCGIQPDLSRDAIARKKKKAPLWVPLRILTVKLERLTAGRGTGQRCRCRPSSSTDRAGGQWWIAARCRRLGRCRRRFDECPWSSRHRWWRCGWCRA